MKKGKETHEVLPYSYAVKVSRCRTDKNYLTIESMLKVEGRNPPISLRLGISEADLSRLLPYAFKRDSDFSSEFSLILADAIQQTQTRARGKHRGRELTVSHIKREAGLLYLLFTKVESEPANKYPFFQKILDMYDAEDTDNIEDSSLPFPVILTAYCLEKYYGKRLTRIGLRPFFKGDFNNFNDTYIKPKLKECKKMFSSMTASGLNDIISHEPFKDIFKDMDSWTA